MFCLLINLVLNSKMIVIFQKNRRPFSSLIYAYISKRRVRSAKLEDQLEMLPFLVVENIYQNVQKACNFLFCERVRGRKLKLGNLGFCLFEEFPDWVMFTPLESSPVKVALFLFWKTVRVAVLYPQLRTCQSPSVQGFADIVIC
ncbi:hypothetical protein DsansV1_C01g0001341 [Dioscorea sansibarensis]